MRLWLVILWSAREPHRVGHSAFCEEGKLHLLGRAPQARDGEAPLSFAAARPPEAGGYEFASDAILGEALSRRQLEIRAESNCLIVRNVGRCPMWVNGSLVSRAEIGPGDTVHLQQQILLLCINRPRVFPSLCGYPRERLAGFGAPDADGLVGESYGMWNLRQQLAQLGQGDGHILIVGKSGVGKELVAHALHQLSPTKRQGLVAENIATIPPSLGTALLFGNRRNFPNPGMEERSGLIGLAEGGTLFLDEIGDMSPEVQPLLLRVMEHRGEYTRLGDEAQTRRANVRFIGATNHPERMRAELRRRFHHEIHVPDLNERRDDIPLLVRHILLSRAQRWPALSAYLQNGQPSIDPNLLDQLVRHTYSTHVAELAFLVEQAAADCEERVLLPLPAHILNRRSETHSQGPAQPPSAPPPVVPERAPASTPALPTAEQAQQALDLESGFVARAATRLGISRHQLNRLIRRHRLTVSRESGPVQEGDNSSDD
jgi:two-component system nitrogen regulation response regulator GlnG/two-component system response regulator HydG